MLSLYEAGERERAAARAVQLLPVKVARELARQVAADAIPALVAAATARAPDAVARRVAATARSSPYKGTPGVKWGGNAVISSGGGTARELARAAEFGSPGNKWTWFTGHSPRGTGFAVHRRTTRQFMPSHAAGAFITPAALAVAPGVIDAWETLVEAATAAALDGKA
jgi:hypothetical protein